MTAPHRSPTRGLRTALLAVIAVGLVLLGGGLAVALGIGRGTPTPAADSVDAGFARDMSRHHLQGVEMANLVDERSDDPELEHLAFDISAAQTNQAGRMQGWLALWGLPQSGEPMTWMPADEHAGHDMGAMDTAADMPGMASTEELAELRSLSGTEFDVRFLQLMIRHHQGGFDMARYAAEHADVEAVRDLARSIEQAQGVETTTMTRMLTARGGTPLPEP
ncbi:MULTISPECIES: DUF305 domain-containing protein [unclassified Blastococcus]